MNFTRKRVSQSIPKGWRFILINFFVYYIMVKTKKRYNKKRKTKSKTLRKKQGGALTEEDKIKLQIIYGKIQSGEPMGETNEEKEIHKKIISSDG